MCRTCAGLCGLYGHLYPWSLVLRLMWSRTEGQSQVPFAASAPLLIWGPGCTAEERRGSCSSCLCRLLLTLVLGCSAEEPAPEEGQQGCAPPCSQGGPAEGPSYGCGF